jgi:hypothetical protein
LTRKTKDSATIQKLARTICFVLVLLCAASATAKIDFNRDIRPILSSKCIACHGPDEAAREADLRLDTHEGATESVVDLEDPLESELLARVASSDPDMIMPPPGHGERLTDAEQLRLRQWIEQGAVYAKHWSYAPPVSPKVPTTMLGIQHNEIDAFVQDRLAAANTGLMPARPADRRTIIRRVALDLTGLPPTREEVAAFLADQSDGAYETIVDSYLKSDAFGERWASMWLDLARYADSAGYADDRKRTIWAFRDYVIQPE